jgi:hypothetical protein
VRSRFCVAPVFATAFEQTLKFLQLMDDERRLQHFKLGAAAAKNFWQGNSRPATV